VHLVADITISRSNKRARVRSAQRRASAYGLFTAGYGMFWFLGSALMGVLYDASLPVLIAFAVVAQLAALPALALVSRRQRAASWSDDR
jgi:hypothetical protein